MIPARPARLRLETFEDRLCPAISIRLVGPDLFITGRPLAGPTSGEQFRIQETAPNRFTVQDVTLSGTKTYGTFPVSRLLSVSLALFTHFPLFARFIGALALRAVGFLAAAFFAAGFAMPMTTASILLPSRSRQNAP